MKKTSFLILIILLIMSCSEKKVNPEKWSEKELTTWFENQEWLNGWEVNPDISINKKEFAIQYFKNKIHWDQAFNFLKTADLKNIPLGKQNLEGDHLFIIVSEYESKELEATKYESHKKYIDIQHVITGKEMMGITTVDQVIVDVPYNEENDIAFFTSDKGNYYLATPENFLLFFPSDVHRPSVKDGVNENVKKIVVKVLVE